MRNSILLFFILASLSILISYVIQEVVFTEDVYYASLSEQLSTERIDAIIEQRGELSWIKFVFKPIFYGVKILMVSICIMAGLFAVNKKCSFGSLLGIIIKAEFIFLIPPFIMLIWFGGFHESTVTFDDISNFAPLTLLNLFDSTEIDSWLSYSLSAANMFELFYMFALAYGLSGICEMEFFQSLKITFFSYGTGLLLWIVFVTFLIISFTA